MTSNFINENVTNDQSFDFTTKANGLLASNFVTIDHMSLTEAMIKEREKYRAKIAFVNPAEIKRPITRPVIVNRTVRSPSKRSVRSSDYQAPEVKFTRSPDKEEEILFDVKTKEEIHSRIENIFKVPLTEENKLFEKVFNYQGVNQDIIDIYNDWITYGLIEQLSHYKFNFLDGRYYCKFIRINYTRPKISRTFENQTTHQPRYPQQTLDDGETYEAFITGTYQVYNDKHEPQGKPEQKEIGNMPIMVGSYLCNLSILPRNKFLTVAGQCPNSPMGYFVVKGNEYILITQEKLRTNRILIYMDAKDTSSEKSYMCQIKTRVPGKVSSYTIRLFDNKSLTMSYSFLAGDRYGDEPVSTKPSDMKNAAINTFALLAKLGLGNQYTDLVKKSQFIIKYICKHFVKPVAQEKVKEFLYFTAEDYIKNFTQIEGISDMFGYRVAKLKNKIKNDGKPINAGETADNLFQRLSDEAINLFFRQESDCVDYPTQEEKEFYRKITFPRKRDLLCLCLARFGEFFAGYRNMDNRDDNSTKQLETPGLKIQHQFTGILSNLILNNKKVEERKAMSENRIIDFQTSVDKIIRFESFSRKFTSMFSPSNWGATADLKENIVEQFKTDNTASKWSHVVKTATPTYAEVKNNSVRAIQSSQLGYLCVVDTQDNQNCGLVKAKASTCFITRDRSKYLITSLFGNAKEVPDYSAPRMNDDGSSLMVDPFELRRDPPRTFKPSTDPTKIIYENIFAFGLVINGEYIGWCSGKITYEKLLELKLRRIIWEETAIVFDSDDSKTVFVSCDGARMTRPLLIVDQDGDLILDKIDKTGMPMTPETPVENALRYANYESILKYGAIEYIDPWEAPRCLVAETKNDLMARKAILINLRNQLADIERRLTVDKAKNEELIYAFGQFLPEDKLNRKNTPIENLKQQRDNLLAKLRDLLQDRITHCEIDGQALMSIKSAMVPSANHNPGPRVMTGANQTNSSVGKTSENQECRFDNTQKVGLGVQRAAYATQMESMVGSYAQGEMLLVAYMANSYNQEDAIVLKKQMIERGGLRYMVRKRQKIELDMKSKSNYKNENVKEEFKKPTQMHIDSDYEFALRNKQRREKKLLSRYDHLTEEGIIKIGTKLQETEKFVIATVIRTHGSGKEIFYEIKEYYNGRDNHGIVEDSIVAEQSKKGEKGANIKVVRVKNKEIRNYELHDKLSRRVAQKGTVARIVDETELPQIETFEGVTPDVIVNPLGFPSRLTGNDFIEALCGQLTAITGKVRNATAFVGHDINSLYAELKQFGIQGVVEHIITKPSVEGGGRIYGQNGEPIKALIVPVYYQMLKHHVKDKVNTRSTGYTDPFTHQPVKGRSKEGATKFGEMESDSVISYGGYNFKQERTNFSSDPFIPVFCTKCKNQAVTIASELPEVVCLHCDTKLTFESNEEECNFTYVRSTHSFRIFQQQIGIVNGSVKPASFIYKKK